jgi:uncharacterized protein (TIGR03435 family)
MLKLAAALALTIAGLTLGFSQAIAPTPAFEAASVKPGGTLPIPQLSAPGLKSTGSRITEDPGRITYYNTTLMPLLTRAYDVKRRQVNGPAWLDTQTYDIVATIPKGAPREQIPAMLQHLLAERFKMTVHAENRQEKVYALLIGKNGPRLNRSAAPDSQGVSFDTKGHITFSYYSLAEFAGFLTNTLDRSVIDNTGLPGHYDIAMDVDLAALKLGPPPVPGQEAPDPSPSVFTAIQELGLKLDTRDGTVKHIVIDKADKVPVEN